MSETTKPEHKYTPDDFRSHLEDLCVNYIAYTRPDIIHESTVTLALQASTGERIIIAKSMEGAQPTDNFFQDLLMTIHPGSNPDFGAEQIDFNFNQYGDGELRMRTISGQENGVEEIPEGASEEGIAHLAQLSLHHAMEFQSNLILEEQMGVNNQPVTSDQITEAMGYLRGASVLDHSYRPVATLT